MKITQKREYCINNDGCNQHVSQVGGQNASRVLPNVKSKRAPLG